MKVPRKMSTSFEEDRYCREKERKGREDNFFCDQVSSRMGGLRIKVHTLSPQTYVSLGPRVRPDVIVGSSSMDPAVSLDLGLEAADLSGGKFGPARVVSIIHVIVNG